MADRMQDDAMERLKQMYSKAQSNQVTKVTNQKHGSHEKIRNATENTSRDEPKTFSHPSETPGEKECESSNSSKKESNILDVFMRDKEKSLLVVLLVILISEKADTTLVLALLYLIL